MRLIDADALMPKLRFIREAEHQIYGKESWGFASKCITAIEDAPTVQPTIYGYNVEHLELIARVLQNENVPPERVEEALTDIGHIAGIISAEFEEALRKSVEQCMMRGEQDE